MVDRAGIEDLMELHKVGMVTDEQMQRYVKEYAEHLMSPQIAVDPAAQAYKDGRERMHSHSIKAPPAHASQVPGAHSHTMSGHIMQPPHVKVPLPYMPPKQELMRTLANRLRIREGDTFPLAFIEFHVARDKVYVFCVAENGATIIEDDLTLFPSDSLITAINLLKG